MNSSQSDGTPRTDIFSLFKRHVYLPHKQKSGKTGHLFFFAGVSIICIALYQCHGVDEIRNRSHFFFGLLYFGWFLIALSSVETISRLLREPPADTPNRDDHPLSSIIAIALSHAAILLLISTFALLVVAKNESAVTTLLTAAAAIGMVGMGWVVQYKGSNAESRHAHTISLLMRSRLSIEYQNHINIKSINFPAGKIINPDIAKLRHRSGYLAEIAALRRKAGRDARSAKTSSDRLRILNQADASAILIKRTYNNLQSLKYLLNYYEFLCVGVQKGNLDDELLYRTVSDIAVGLFDDTAAYRKVITIANRATYESFEEVVGKNWKPRLIAKREKQASAAKALGDA